MMMMSSSPRSIHYANSKFNINIHIHPNSSNSKSSNSNYSDDGLDSVEAYNSWRYPDDERLRELCRIMRSTTPHYLRVERTPDSTDIQHRHKQQLKLLSICKRALATTIGRGMVTIDSLNWNNFMPYEKIPVSYTNLSGRVPPTNSILHLDMSNAPSDMTLWPDFHSGVAAGLRVSSPIIHNNISKREEGGGRGRGEGEGRESRKQHEEVEEEEEKEEEKISISRNWILYNRPLNNPNNTEAGSEAEKLFEREMASYSGMYYNTYIYIYIYIILVYNTIYNTLYFIILTPSRYYPYYHYL